MKKKKMLLAALAAGCVLSGGIAIAGCTSTPGETPHICDFSTEWSFDGENHFHKCKDETCNKVSGAVAHDKTTTDTATCTEDGEKITTCTQEGCGYVKTEPSQALGHDWDDEHPVEEATHLKEGKIGCKREGCTETKPIEKLEHTYNWTYKDGTTHTGVCTGKDCAGLPAVEKPHNFGEEEYIYNYKVYTCADCGAELADFEVAVVTNSEEFQLAYTKSVVTVSLYIFEDGEHVKVAEAQTDKTTGKVNFKVPEGKYLVAVDNEAHDIACNEAVMLNFDKNDQNTTSSVDVHVGNAVQYTYKLYYGKGNENPAANVDITVAPELIVTNMPQAMAIAKGKTDENGEFTFTLSDNFASATTSGIRIYVSGYDTENYKNFSAYKITKSDKTVIETHIAPQKLTYTVKVKAGDDFIDGVKVTFEDGGSTVLAEATTENGVANIGELDSAGWYIYLELPEEIDALYRVSGFIQASDIDGETIVELVKKAPTYIFTVSGDAEDLSGIKLVVKDGEGATVAEGTTDEEGKFTAELPLVEYTLCIDKTTLPEGFTVNSFEYTIPATGVLDYKTNTVSRSVSLVAIFDLSVTVRSGSKNNYVYYENVNVKFLLDGELISSGTTNEEGVAVCAGLVNGKRYDVVLENLPENMICSTTYLFVDAEFPEEALSLVASADYELTIKDEDGNALAGATVSLMKYTYSNRGYYSISEEVKGLTDENGLVTLSYKTSTTLYTVNVVAADGTKYWAQANLSSNTQGEKVTAELTAHAYETGFPLSGISAATPPYFSGDYIDQEVLLTVTSKREESFGYYDSSKDAYIENGTYKFEIVNPENVDYNVTLYCGMGDWGLNQITEENEYVTCTRDESGNIISVTVNFDKDNSDSYFRVGLTHNKASDEKGTEMFRLLVNITKIA